MRDPREQVGRFLVKILLSNAPSTLKDYVRTELKKSGTLEIALAAARADVLDTNKTIAQRKAALDTLIKAFRGD
jgi:hypothetical protein